MAREETIGKERHTGLRINLARLTDAVARLADDAEAGRGFSIFTLNLDHLVKLKVDRAFREAYRRATYITADGWPVAWLLRRQGSVVERTTGADLVDPLCREAAKRGIPIHLFGSSAHSLWKAAEHLQGRHRGLIVAGMDAPPYGFDPESDEAEAAARKIADSGARLCFVALGAPKQELFADRAHSLYPDIGFLCIGAALDFLSGEQKRAPILMQKTGTEWLYRLLSNPKRLFVRYWRSGWVFIETAIRQMLGRPDPCVDFSYEDINK